MVTDKSQTLIRQERHHQRIFSGLFDLKMLAKLGNALGQLLQLLDKIHRKYLVFAGEFAARGVVGLLSLVEGMGGKWFLGG